MSLNAIPSPDGQYIDVFVPIAFKRIGGRKVIVAPDGTTVDPQQSKAIDSTLVKALARAHRWRKLLEDGVYATIAELADAERINRSYVSRTLRLSLLAPDIVEAIVNGTHPSTLQLAQLEAPFPLEWEQQRQLLGFRPAPAVEPKAPSRRS